MTVLQVTLVVRSPLLASYAPDGSTLPKPRCYSKS